MAFIWVRSIFECRDCAGASCQLHILKMDHVMHDDAKETQTNVSADDVRANNYFFFSFVLKAKMQIQCESVHCAACCCPAAAATLQNSLH